MPDWLLFVLFVVVVMGGTIGFRKLLPPPKIDSNAPKLNLAASFTGTVVDGQVTLSPAQVPCVAYGVVLGRMEGEDNDEFVVLHRGGWTDGFEIRTKEGVIISVPKGPIHVDGEWDETDGRNVSSYLAVADVSGEASGAVFASVARILESRVEMNAHVTVYATRFEEQGVQAHGAEPPYRHGQRSQAAQGHILVRAGLQT